MTTTSNRLIRALSGLAVAAVVLAACGGKSEADLTASGQKLMEAKDYTGAIIQFKSALQAKPDSGLLRLLLGKALLENGDAVSALVELQKAQELQVADNDVIPAMAQAMLLAGEDTKLLAQYGSAQLTDKQASADLWASLAAAYLLRGDEPRATALIARARLPVEPPVLPVERWLELMGHDKKVEAGRLRFVLMKKLGQAYVDADVPTDVLSRVLSAPDAHV